MAEEAVENGENGENGEAGDGGVLKKWGPIAAVVLLVQGVLAWVLIQFALKDNLPEQQPQEQLIPVTQEVVLTQANQNGNRTRLPFLYYSKDLDQITANPAGTNAERFAVLGVQLGLEAYDHDQNPPEDITESLETNLTLTDPITKYDLKIKAIILRIIRAKTVDELDSSMIPDLQDEIRQALNTEIFSLLFLVDEDNKTEVRVAEVNISSLVVQ